MFTIQPGLLFSDSSVRYFRAMSMTDDDVAALIATVESDDAPPPGALVFDWTRNNMPVRVARDIVMASTVGGIA